MTSKPSGTYPPDEDALKVLLGWYASERSDGASLMTAGFTQVTGMLAYVGVVTTLVGKAPPPTPLVILAAPIPALLLLVFYTVHSFNQGLRATSARTLEQLIYPSLSGYVTSQPLPGHHRRLRPTRFHRNREVDLRRVALGLHATELFFNASHANRWHAALLTCYYLLAAIVVLGFTGILDTVGLFAVFGQSVAHDWTVIQWTLLWTEFGVGIALAILFACFTASGIRHRNRAEDAAVVVIANAGTTPPPDPEPLPSTADQQATETALALPLRQRWTNLPQALHEYLLGSNRSR
ncbi:hypothetical protein IU479_27100 [Nocardia abscessus]|uniref:hypothetical protein n=1 Tax=Nocardia abscessus TaxID=120957 RepID=UPI0018949A2D|nr:hypothetical protein [Nocardia abscessus]MBF6221768.1 hypothetical protein [Nocardia abscessus]